MLKQGLPERWFGGFRICLWKPWTGSLLFLVAICSSRIDKPPVYSFGVFPISIHHYFQSMPASDIILYNVIQYSLFVNPWLPLHFLSVHLNASHPLSAGCVAANVLFGISGVQHQCSGLQLHLWSFRPRNPGGTGRDEASLMWPSPSLGMHLFPPTVKC